MHPYTRERNSVAFPDRWGYSKGMTQTAASIRDQIARTIDAQGPSLAQGIDIDAVADEIVSTYGVMDIDNIDSAEFWDVVRRHDSTQSEDA
jgi:predicted HAD superfamily Cof-like phosphohydrolase